MDNYTWIYGIIDVIKKPTKNDLLPTAVAL